MRKIIVLTMLLFVAGLGVAYADSLKLPDMHPDITGSQPQGVPSISGKVVETMNSGGYTYVNIEKDGKNTWVALPDTEVKVGQDISVAQGAVMTNFTSKTLDRTFDTIIFSTGVIRPGDTSGQSVSSHDKPETAAVRKIKVEKAEGPNAYTVAELYEKIAELNEKSIVVRGQVVKVSEKIMGKNWVHLQDGSGTASSGDNDIIVTTQDLPSVGDVVTASGTLYKDKDFGSGYKYSAIVEEGTIKK